jgi:hypothetical protein
MKVRKAVFPAAGLGTRFLPATKAQPKEMLPISLRLQSIGGRVPTITGSPLQTSGRRST